MQGHRCGRIGSARKLTDPCSSICFRNGAMYVRRMQNSTTYQLQCGNAGLLF
jgi:hypothetical protein